MKLEIQFLELESYTLERFRADVLSLFLHLVKNNFTVELSHEDFVGKVNFVAAVIVYLNRYYCIDSY